MQRGWVIESLRIGPTMPLGPRNLQSGIVKQAVDRPVRLTKAGFIGDDQGDKRHHGGPDKAVHHYPRDRYSSWQAEIGNHPLLRSAGAFGENVSTLGLTEADVAVGDRFRLGGAILQVSQGRQPCFRLDLRFELPEVAVRMQHNGHTGWYYRVLEEGTVAPDDTLHLLDRLTPGWTIARLHRSLFLDPLNVSELRGMAALAHLPERWRQTAARRLRSGCIEDWSRRLKGA